MKRRNFIWTTAVLCGGYVVGYSSKQMTKLYSIAPSTMQDETKKHKRTWMVFVANSDIWSPRQIPKVKKDLALLATTIAKYEPVSMLVSKADKLEAIRLLGGLDRHKYPITLVEFVADDLWIRDTAPVFVLDKEGKKGAINFNFNGWGKKQKYRHDSKIADFIAKKSKSKIINSNYVLEGGSIEIDGTGTAILTESSVLNDNRNPNTTKKELEKELKTLLGLKKIIWLKGIKGEDITDGHVDFYARFVKVGTVLMARENDTGSYDYDITRENIKKVQNSTDASGDRLKVIIIDNPTIYNKSFGIDDFAPGYMGYYVCNHAIIIQKFGDTIADQKAYATIQRQFPDRTIEQISIDGIASGGGTIHCSTQQEPID